MRPRKLKLIANLSGFPMALGVVSVKNFAHVREAKTDLVCRTCGKKPSYSSLYKCECGEEVKHWSGLNRIVSATHQIIEMVKLTQDGQPSEATVYVLDQKTYASKYADATLTEYGMIASDATTAQNVRKLLVAVDRLGMVIVIRFNDTNEQRVCLLTVSASNRVVLREIIPTNLAEISETLAIDLSLITDADINESQQLVKMLKQADDAVFAVTDYRTIGLGEVTAESPKVQSLKEILASVTAK